MAQVQKPVFVQQPNGQGCVLTGVANHFLQLLWRLCMSIIPTLPMLFGSRNLSEKEFLLYMQVFVILVIIILLNT